MSNFCFSPLSLFQYFLAFDSLELRCIAILSPMAELPTMSFSLYLLLFALTYLLEFPVYAALRPKGTSLQRVALYTLGLNVATHPVVNWVFPRVAVALGWETSLDLLLSEIFAVIVEFLVLMFIFRSEALRHASAALLANVASLWVGVKILDFVF